MPLRVLRPSWLALPGREHMGVELDCPVHPDGHRVELWFENPCDGGPPAAGKALCWLASACDFEDLTVVPMGTAPYRPLVVGHWTGWLIESNLQECRVVGVAW